MSNQRLWYGQLPICGPAHLWPLTNSKGLVKNYSTLGIDASCQKCMTVHVVLVCVCLGGGGWQLFTSKHKVTSNSWSEADFNTDSRSHFPPQVKLGILEVVAECQPLAVLEKLINVPRVDPSVPSP